MMPNMVQKFQDLHMLNRMGILFLDFTILFKDELIVLSCSENLKKMKFKYLLNYTINEVVLWEQLKI